MGLRKLFGEELNKDLLLDFLNELLKEEQGQIKNITYLKNEHLGATEVDRKAIFDLYCENELGEKSIVELQKTTLGGPLVPRARLSTASPHARIACASKRR